jgi:prepilin-type N-terminal cleavage/methylation domain-containing protein
MRPGVRGFTFIEVLACLLVVSLGIAAVVSLTLYAEIMSERAQAKSTAMATALAVTIDPAPLLHPSAASQWNTTTVNGTITSTGWINGYYVVRVESTKLGSSPSPGFASNPVSVDVFGGVRGTLVASYTTRLMEQPVSP